MYSKSQSQQDILYKHQPRYTFSLSFLGRYVSTIRVFIDTDWQTIAFEASDSSDSCMFSYQRYKVQY